MRSHLVDDAAAADDRAGSYAPRVQPFGDRNNDSRTRLGSDRPELLRCGVPQSCPRLNETGTPLKTQTSRPARKRPGWVRNVTPAREDGAHDGT